MTQRKSFFREREVREIQDLSTQTVYYARGLVDRIDNLNPSNEALEIRTNIVPGRFFPKTTSEAEASRKCYKHGDLILLSHPRTQEGCYNTPEIPLATRARDFDKLRTMKEEEINFVGYSFQPTWGDRKKRVVPFAWLPEGLRLFSYSENIGNPIKIEPYADARKVISEGASIVAEVPSRSRKQPRYKFKLLHVPVIRSEKNLATVLTLKPGLVLEDEENPENVSSGRTAHETYNIKYNWEKDREGSEVVTFYPQDVAAYISIIKHFNGKHNLTPIEMNPFAIPSQHQAEFYKKLGNNILMYDATLSSKDKLRKLHIAEKSILLARALGKFGNDDFAYWDPARDGKLKDYDWQIPK